MQMGGDLLQSTPKHLGSPGSTGGASAGPFLQLRNLKDGSQALGLKW